MIKVLMCKYHIRVCNKCRQIPQTPLDRWTAAHTHTFTQRKVLYGVTHKQIHIHRPDALMCALHTNELL